MVVDPELRLVETRLERLRDAERHAHLGQGYPTASPLYRIMRGDTSRATAPGGLTAVERAQETEAEIEETLEAIKRLPDYLKQPLILVYLDPRKEKLAEKIPETISERKFFDDLRCAKHRLTGILQCS